MATPRQNQTSHAERVRCHRDLKEARGARKVVDLRLGMSEGQSSRMNGTNGSLCCYAEAALTSPYDMKPESDPDGWRARMWLS